LKVLFLIKDYTQIKTRLVMNFNGWPPTSAGQRTYKGPPAVPKDGLAEATMVK
jgi:hypothetical protein